ncbi:hypothetical protein KC343_g34 [Hortaea werneckii]|nr:hypothetical protein KC346_g37 [Hortaea werneckii]KAI7638481.1 hypothetical protein KC343_g34 [Hortaea werneckii]
MSHHAAELVTRSTDKRSLWPGTSGVCFEWLCVYSFYSSNYFSLLISADHPFNAYIPVSGSNVHRYSTNGINHS